MLRSAFKVMHDVGDGLDRQAVEFIATTCSQSTGLSMDPLLKRFMRNDFTGDADASVAIANVEEFVTARVSRVTIDGEPVEPAEFFSVVPFRTVFAMALEIVNDRFTKKAKPSGSQPESPAPATATEN